jgi:hypothetical protein
VIVLGLLLISDPELRLALFNEVISPVHVDILRRAEGYCKAYFGAGINFSGFLLLTLTSSRFTGLE